MTAPPAPPPSPCDAGWQASACTLPPWEVACRASSQGGLVFLDSALALPGARSLVTGAPWRVLSGTDWDALDMALDQWVFSPDPEDPARSLAAGAFSYEGAFHVGFYRAAACYDHDSSRWQHRGAFLDNLSAHPPVGTGCAPVFLPKITAQEYCEKVRRAREYIAAGDIYQVNLAQCFQCAAPVDALDFYGKLRTRSPKPYAAWIDAGPDTLLCASPELFLDIRGRDILTRPIKGTRPRHPDSARDSELAGELRASEKEAAELLMITDLERNDLGQVCETGSVRVRELSRLESYQQVHHLVSTVTGRLRPEVSACAALRACFPGGSITGAPKKRAMEIIAELEPCPRGWYTGAAGCFGWGDRSVFNILIRTAVVGKESTTFHVGAGIVADSIPENEYRETLDKAAGLLAAASR